MESIVSRAHAPTVRDFRGVFLNGSYLMWFIPFLPYIHLKYQFFLSEATNYTTVRSFLSSIVNPVISPGESITSHWWHHCDTTSGHVVVLLEICKLVVFDHFAILKWGRVRGDSGKSEAAPVDTHCSIVHIGHKQKITSKKNKHATQIMVFDPIPQWPHTLIYHILTSAERKFYQDFSNINIHHTLPG